ncbi:Hypothetical predicted protein [Lecanosticta acicola]|uniref:Transcription elongation factor Eaf N-terminal domain-containing protein n=1 Tax=Lecanosticta acicola TaxID=111012 RepID=A0AAI8VUW4_9PEZI|nr:Hypothetical predicted protein [Lecanosticta acicola]
MAAAAPPPPAPVAIDLKSQATFPIRLGASILKSSSSPSSSSSSPSCSADEGKRFTNLRYNHKPHFKHGGGAAAAVKARIRQGDEAGESRLELEDGEGKYAYSGRYGHDEESYVLVIRGNEGVLERVGTTHGFNLIQTPSESDAAKLAERYPPLGGEDEGEDDLFGEEEEDAPPDEGNPFDYRHFLKAELEKAESTNANLDASRTPHVVPKPTVSTAATSKPARRTGTETKTEPAKKRKTPATNKANAKRLKAGQESTTASSAAATTAGPVKPKAKPEVPKINLDRKASLDDSGELILENETPITEKPPKHSAMALALQGQLNGPISLRSAANSPGSHVASPAPQRPEGVEEAYVFEFDDDPEPEPEPTKENDDDEEEEDEDARDGDEEDGDVEDFELPSPAQNRDNREPAPGDEEDDLDKQLALAMMEEDDGGHQQESEEESEEE